VLRPVPATGGVYGVSVIPSNPHVPGVGAFYHRN
jgi:hypothetical protein